MAWLRTDLALDAIEMAIWARTGELEGVVAQSDRGSQYLSTRYTDRLAEAAGVTSVGSKGDSSTSRSPRRSSGSTDRALPTARSVERIDGVEYGTLEYVDWFNPPALARADRSRPAR
jgi:putative transposase